MKRPWPQVALIAENRRPIEELEEEFPFITASRVDV